MFLFYFSHFFLEDFLELFIFIVGPEFCVVADFVVDSVKNRFPCKLYTDIDYFRSFLRARLCAFACYGRSFKQLIYNSARKVLKTLLKFIAITFYIFAGVIVDDTLHRGFGLDCKFGACRIGCLAASLLHLAVAAGDMLSYIAEHFCC